MSGRGGLLVAVLAALLVAVPAPARLAAQTGAEVVEGVTPVTGPLDDPALEAEATRLSSELRCPVCQGLSIHDSPSPLAQQMKNLIRSQLAAGWTEAEVEDYFISKYGEWVLLEPKAKGFNLLVYLLPALMLLGGAAIIVVALRRWTGPPPEEPATQP